MDAGPSVHLGLVMPAPFHWRSAVLRYAAAIVFPAVGLGLSLLLYPFAPHLPALLFLGSVAITAWFGGLRAGLLATLLSVLLTNFFFHAPRYQLTLNMEEGIELAIFASIAALISKLVAERHFALMELRQTNERLEELVAERTAELRQANVLLREANRQLQAEIRERQQMAQELKRSNAELEQFASAASHDLQEPLRTINAFSQLLDRRVRGVLSPEDVELLQIIQNAAQRMRGLITDLLAYARLGGSQRTQDLVGMQDVLSAVGEQLKLSISETGSEVTCLGSLPEVWGDRTQFVQLFQNLIGNAVKYRHPDRPLRVEISCRQENGEWAFSVKDNGIGFEAGQAELIFGVFKRLHGREIPGTGIGLALCRKIVETHGGRIWATSEPGKGSTFTFTLPVKRKAGENPGNQAAASA
jgi:signal transduction histidine kinase